MGRPVVESKSFRGAQFIKASANSVTVSKSPSPKRW